MRKYDKLQSHLMTAITDRLRVRFSEIEQLLGFALPGSARRHPAWWANDSNPDRHSSAWLSAGWKTEELDLGSEQVTFVRAREPQSLAHASGVVRAPRAVPATAQRFDELPDAPEGTVEVATSMQWKHLGALALDGGGALVFPPAPTVPGLYRFRLNGAAAMRRYVGETTELRRRFQHYRTPGPTQATNIRINDILRTHLTEGGTIELDIIAGNVTLRIGHDASSLDLADKAARRLLEHAALVAGGAEDIESLNR